MGSVLIFRNTNLIVHNTVLEMIIHSTLYYVVALFNQVHYIMLLHCSTRSTILCYCTVQPGPLYYAVALFNPVHYTMLLHCSTRSTILCYCTVQPGPLYYAVALFNPVHYTMLLHCSTRSTIDDLTQNLGRT